MHWIEACGRSKNRVATRVHMFRGEDVTWKRYLDGRVFQNNPDGTVTQIRAERAEGLNDWEPENE